jgi:hypothetical protein
MTENPVINELLNHPIPEIAAAAKKVAAYREALKRNEITRAEFDSLVAGATDLRTVGDDADKLRQRVVIAAILNRLQNAASHLGG